MKEEDIHMPAPFELRYEACSGQQALDSPDQEYLHANCDATDLW